MSIYNKIFPLEELPDRIRLTVSRSKLALNLADKLGRELKPDKWIFIVGCYNSGTTLLHNILANHPDVGAFTTEGVELTDQLPRPEHFGWPRMWLPCLEQMLIPPGEENKARASRIKRQWSRWLPRGKKYILEKSITNATRMMFLQEHFQPAAFIYIMRNGYAVAEEIRRAADLKRFKHDSYSDQYPIKLCADQWVKSDEIIEETKGGIKRFIQISYEDLVANQAKVINELTDFLEIPAVPESAYNNQIKVHRKWSEIRDMNGEAIQRLSPDDIRSIEESAGAVLEKYGYHL